MNLLTEEEKQLIKNAANLMEQLIETIEVSEDMELQKEIKEALSDAERGDTKPLKQLLKELEINV
ncbi:MAG: hypothetical protein NWE89_16960 [Candidatus Bathyarchaeota archaeon]|nr:hypothetical protein [Candidatus Bathyarchaeota archaeon]